MNKKLAVCVGINDYPGTDNDLNGCVNDANDWADALKARGFGVTTVLDGDATKAAMIGTVTEMLDQCVSGDTAVFTYSGHGTWVPDDNGDEPDGRDEALCPWDCITTGEVLKDDEIHQIFLDHRKRGVRLVFFSDSCHSGSVSRFMRPLQKAAIDDVLPHRIRFMAPEVFLKGRQLDTAHAVKNMPRNARRTAYSSLLFSGCKDDEYSYDASFGGRGNGAFTYVALKALKGVPEGAEYKKYYADIRAMLPSVDYPQTPLLDGSSSWKSWSPIL